MTARLSDIRYLLIDMDGVLYRGAMGLPGGPELLAFLRDHDIPFLMLTNNSTATPAQFVERLAGFGMTISDEEVMTSGVATAEYLRRRATPGTRINVVGEQGLITVLERRGFVMAGRDAEYVVCGWDKTINFEKLKTATLAIRDGATFVGTNPDKTYPTEYGIIPGAGALIACLVAATDVEPVIIGKPQPTIFKMSMEILGGDPEHTAILGDRLDTDILGGAQAGIKTLMVLTGISSREEALAFESPPDLLYDDLTALVQAWHEDLS